MEKAKHQEKRAGVRRTLFAGFIAIAAIIGGYKYEGGIAHASEVRVVVNNEVVTSYDIARRVAFLRLQRRSGNLNGIAEEQLTEEALKRYASRRAGIRIPDSMVDSAYANFARNNNLSTGQLNNVLNQSGVTT
ncbi:MAG: peptidylprolyl isomerase, partial [Pseudomonadota bacterium]